MNTILVCQLDHRGFFIGTTEADESPLEPGVYHLPGGCVQSDPPEFEHDQQTARFVNGVWVLEDIQQAEQQLPETQDIEEDQQPLAAWQVLANRREAYAVESDSLKIEAEYDAIMAGGEPDYTEWLAKVAEIKKRHPMPEEAAE